MSHWYDEIRPYSDKLFNGAPLIAAEFDLIDCKTYGCMVGGPWRIVGERMHEGEPWTSLTLVRGDGMQITLAADRHTNKITARPRVPQWPTLTGTGSASLKDYVPRNVRTDMDISDTLEAAVSLVRYVDHPVQTARDLYRRVVAPYAKVFPLVLARVTELETGIKEQKEMTARLVNAFKGAVQRERGDIIYITFPGSLPDLEVRYDGSICTARPIYMSELITYQFLTLLDTKTPPPPITAERAREILQNQASAGGINATLDITPAERYEIYNLTKEHESHLNARMRDVLCQIADDEDSC